MKAKYWILTLSGLALLVAGLVLVRGSMVDRTFPYLMIGVGCGAFGYGSGELLKQWALKNDPAAAKRLRVEQEDERNQAVANRAKARAFDMALYIYNALLLCFALMQVDLSVILLLVAGNLIVLGIFVYFQIRYNKEM